MYVHIMKDGILFDNKYLMIIYQQFKFSSYYLIFLNRQLGAIQNKIE